MTQDWSHCEVAVLGGGISGCTYAAQLSKSGHQVIILEKSRGAGGRASSRYLNANGTKVSHLGLPYFMPRSRAFKDQLMGFVSLGKMTQVPLRTFMVQKNGYKEEEVIVGQKGPADFCHLMLDESEQEVKFLTRFFVDRLEKSDAGWIVHGTENDKKHSVHAKRVVLTFPAPQSIELMQNSGLGVAPIMESVGFTPHWVVVLRGTISIFNELDEVVFPSESERSALPQSESEIAGEQRVTLSLATLRRHLKGGSTDASGESEKTDEDKCLWVLQATAEWSQENMDLDKNTVASELLRSLESCTGVNPEGLTVESVHRWKYGSTNGVLLEEPISMFENTLVISSDWVGNGTADSAFKLAIQGAKSVHNSLAVS